LPLCARGDQAGVHGRAVYAKADDEEEACQLEIGHSYPSLNYSGTPFLFEDGFFIRMSLYTYVSSMLGFFINKYRRDKRQGSR